MVQTEQSHKCDSFLVDYYEMLRAEYSKNKFGIFACLIDDYTDYGEDEDVQFGCIDVVDGKVAAILTRGVRIYSERTREHYRVEDVTLVCLKSGAQFVAVNVCPERFWTE